MKKELIICIVIIGIILIGNYITGIYEEKAIKTINNNLEEIKMELEKQEKEEKIIKKKLENLKENWNKVYTKLAYFIEHNELEKVETSIIILTSFCKTKVYEKAVSEIDKSMFVLNHIQEKDKLKLENIF